MTTRRATKIGLATALFLVFVVWILNPASPASPATRLTYVVVKEEVYDEPIKTQIVQHIVVFGVPTEAELKAEIFKRYRSAKARRGFRYHNPATNIYIYVYGTKEQARAQGIRWIGMIAMGPLDKVEPRAVVDEGRLAGLSQKPEDRFGLSEQKRKRVFREMGADDRRAMRKARARFSDAQFLKQFDLSSKLEEEYREELAVKYNLTRDQLRDIVWEGVTMGWLD